MIPFVADPDFTLYIGDALGVLRELPDESADCCVTSPPYFNLRDYGIAGQLGRERTLGEYVAALVAVFAEVRRLLKPHGTLWLNLGDSYNAYNGGSSAGGPVGLTQSAERPGLPKGYGMTEPSLKPKDLLMVPARAAIALQDDGWWLRMDNVWSKPNPMPESVTDRPTKAHEFVYLLAKSGTATHWRHADGRVAWIKPEQEYEVYQDEDGTERRRPLWRGCDYWYDKEAISEPATWFGPNGKPKSGPHAGQMHGRAGKNPTWEERKAAGATRGNVAFDGNVGAGTQRGVHGKGVSHNLGDGLTRNARSVWTIQTQQYADAHVAVFPDDLPKKCILAGCPAGGIVLDPFMGSGTTALVARKLGRRSVGIELNPEYARLAAERLSQLSLLADGTAAA